MKYVVITGYTKGTPYEEEAKVLIASLIKFGLAYEVYEYEDRKDWALNTHYKINLIRQALKEFRCNIVWIDSDAEVLSPPALFDTITEDVAFHFGYRAECFCGTLFFQYNHKVFEFLDEWQIQCESNNRYHDQVNFAIALKKSKLNLAIRYLPICYAYIFDWLPVCKSPVIIHNQANRRFKSIINRGKYGGK